MPSYRDFLQRIRLCFPQPISDRVHDSYFVHSIMRALDQVDGLKTEIPILGQTVPIDYAVGQQAKLGPELGSLEQVTEDLVGYLQVMPLASHPRTQQNVVAPPSIPSLIGVLLASLYNPNLVSDEYSRRVSLAEVEVVAMVADLVGFDPVQAGGVFTFGGTGTSLYGVKIGLEKALPGAMKNGIQGDLVLLASDASHYCRHNIAGWLGLGTNQLCTIPTRDDNSIDLVQLADRARQALQAGKKSPPS
jgi:L-2,4-diaminobutyrate decarboxylase